MNLMISILDIAWCDKKLSCFVYFQTSHEKSNNPLRPSTELPAMAGLFQQDHEI